VTAARTGYTSTTASTSGAALNTGTTPTFSTPVSTADGYTFTLTNFSSSVTYTLSATNDATVVINVFGQVTVTGLPTGTSSTTTVTATRSGYTTATASTSGSALTKAFSPGDFTGDHKADLLTIRPNGYLYLYRGNGRGGVTGTRTKIGTGWGSFTKVLSSGDFNGDHKADILAVQPNGDLYLYRGTGLGGFIGVGTRIGAGTRIGTGWDTFTNMLSPGDFTGDHKADILAARPDGNLYLFPGNGLGKFTTGGTRISVGWAS
jgi:hypothetical protein